MLTRRRVTIFASVVTVAAVLAVVFTRPFGLGYEKLEPVGAAVARSDPSNLYISVIWPYDGICPNYEIHPIVDEEADRVVIQRVERRPIGSQGCAGVGTVPGSEQFGPVKLRRPLGDRAVIRGRDAEQFAVRTLGV
jgi:hypothetical protein